MVEVYNLKEKKEYLKEVATLEYLEWGSKVNNKRELELKVDNKVNKIIKNFDNPYFCKLILLDDNCLVGFISLFEFDDDYKKNLKLWYATMYVKKEYRSKGYSKILNDAILKEAKDRGFKRVYLKTELENYYEKFGAVYIEILNNDEKLYYIDLH